MIEQQLFEPAGMTRSSARYSDLLAEPDRSAIHIEIDGKWTVGPTRQPDPRPRPGECRRA
jgi:CubicO group peptidase (beta-lactamase class C family)